MEPHNPPAAMYFSKFEEEHQACSYKSLVPSNVEDTSARLRNVSTSLEEYLVTGSPLTDHRKFVFDDSLHNARSLWKTLHWIPDAECEHLVLGKKLASIRPGQELRTNRELRAWTMREAWDMQGWQDSWRQYAHEEENKRIALFEKRMRKARETEAQETGAQERPYPSPDEYAFKYRQFTNQFTPESSQPVCLEDSPPSPHMTRPSAVQYQSFHPEMPSLPPDDEKFLKLWRKRGDLICEKMKEHDRQIRELNQIDKNVFNGRESERPHFPNDEMVWRMLKQRLRSSEAMQRMKRLQRRLEFRGQSAQPPQPEQPEQPEQSELQELPEQPEQPEHSEQLEGSEHDTLSQMIITVQERTALYGGDEPCLRGGNAPGAK